MHFNGSDFSRRKPAWLVAAGLALALTLVGCGGSNGEDPSPTPTPATQSPAASSTEATPEVEPVLLADIDDIDVSSDWGTEPTVDAPYPFKVDSTINKVVITGDGPTVPSQTASVEVHYVGINARTGQTFDSSWAAGDPVVFPLAQLIPGFGKGVADQPVGSRVAVAITSADGYDPSGQPSIGIEPGDTLLFIIDIIDSELAGPSGETVAVPSGLPQVSETDGVPGITIPDGLAEPTEVRVQALIQGTGRELGAGDALTSNAVCTTWDGNEYYNDFGEAPVSDAAAGAVHQALFEALVGQQTGSRVLVVLPGTVAYPHGNTEPSIAPQTAVACVVDILFTQTYA
ncbi:MAG: FKBP-type peptidyl-prolyl cis-trans isomerase [Brooklawnia sp.]